MEEPLPTLHTAFSADSVEGQRLRIHSLGWLLTSGAVVACDPLTTAGAKPFAPPLPAGRFPVELLLATRDRDTRVALARVRFGEGEPARFALALREGQDERALAPGQRFGFGVDAGMACFAEAGLEGSADEAILDELDAHRELTWTWALREPGEGGHGLLMFSSGYGDGVYSSYVGYDEAGAPLCLVTDLGVLELELPEVKEDPEFRRRYARELWTRLLSRVEQSAKERHSGAPPGAYELASELVASPEDAAPLIEAMWEAYHGADSPVLLDLFFYAIRGTARGPSAFLRSLPQLERAPALSPRQRQELLRAARELPEEAHAELLGRADGLPAELRVLLFERATVSPRLRAEPSFSALLEEALHGRLGGENRGGGVRAALRHLWVVAKEEPGALDPVRIARVQALAEGGLNPSIREEALLVLHALGRFPEALLEDPDPQRRLEAASALGRAKGGAEEADLVLLALVLGAELDPDRRLEAAGRIRDPERRAEAWIVIGLEGNPAAALQLGYLRDLPLAARSLERLAKEATSEPVRAYASRALRTVKERMR